ncbi:DUF368 domain-containing protein [Cytophagaceae bacterium ABcell3]|nr:DUF368 domain-containing protein [Cytophagaceae bacterium ABcell3]
MKQENYISLFFKGAAMGAADVVPGVSGGTIAFISGIYEKLIESISSVNIEALKLLTSFKFKELWEHVNGTFLLTLFAGIGFSILTLSRVFLYLLQNHPILLWSFFFGLIIGSVFLIFPQITKWTVPVVISGVAGIVIATYITTATPGQTPEAYWFIFLAGSIAICAMILPGISGSFILLILAKYEFILDAISSVNIPVILVFMAGAVTGLLSFSKFLKYLLSNYHNITVALLTGFMIGSLNKVWPWKNTLAWYTDRKGEEKPMIQENVSPFTYAELTGQEHFLIGAIALAIIGFVAVYTLGALSMKKEANV